MRKSVTIETLTCDKCRQEVKTLHVLYDKQGGDSRNPVRPISELCHSCWIELMAFLGRDDTIENEPETLAQKSIPLPKPNLQETLSGLAPYVKPEKEKSIPLPKPTSPFAH